MKKTVVLIIAVMSFFCINLKAQDDPNCGIIIDGIKVDTINCLSFGEMNVVFPFDKIKWKKYAKTAIVIHWDRKGKHPWENKAEIFLLEFQANQLDEYFNNDVEYVVWKFLRDKKTDDVEVTFSNGEKRDFGRKKIAYDLGMSEWWLEVRGYTPTGDYHIDENGHSEAKYSNITLYKSKKVFTPTDKGFQISYKEAAPCPVKGTTLNLKIEPSGGYIDYLGVVKNSSGTNSQSSTTTDNQAATTTSAAPANNSKSAGSKSSSNNKMNDYNQQDKTANAKSGAKDGPYEKKDNAGNIVEKGQYSNGKKTGKWTNYGKNSQVLVETEYTNDQMNGKSSHYDNNGGLSSVQTWVNGKMEGEKTVYTGGKVSGVYNYKDNQMSGFYKSYQPDTGKLKEEGSYAAGKKDGTWKKYDTKTGKLVKTEVYKNGLVVSTTP